MSKLVTVYDDIEIAYDEKENLWKFELDGREHHAVSLGKAREHIDKQPGEKRTFKPFEAYHWRYGSVQFVKVTVTSQAATTRWDSSPHFWTTESRKRQKVSGRYLLTINESNDLLIAQIAKLDAKAKALMKQSADARAQLQTIGPIQTVSLIPESSEVERWTIKQPAKKKAK